MAGFGGKPLAAAACALTGSLLLAFSVVSTTRRTSRQAFDAAAPVAGVVARARAVKPADQGSVGRQRPVHRQADGAGRRSPRIARVGRPSQRSDRRRSQQQSSIRSIPQRTKRAKPTGARGEQRPTMRVGSTSTQAISGGTDPFSRGRPTPRGPRNPERSARWRVVDRTARGGKSAPTAPAPASQSPSAIATGSHPTFAPASLGSGVSIGLADSWPRGCPAPVTVATSSEEPRCFGLDRDCRLRPSGRARVPGCRACEVRR